MTLFSLILAFALEQLRPLDAKRFVSAPLSTWAHFLEGRLDDGQARHGIVAWIVGVAVPTLMLCLAYVALYRIQPVLAFVLNVGVLYLTMGFRQFSHYFTDIHIALRMGEIDHARVLIGQWRGRSADQASSEEVARLAIEEALVASHRHVFGVVFWFVLVPGPAGALAYRLADFFARKWGRGPGAEATAFGEFARRAFELIDWLPARVTAVCFAVVGDFEDALYCWRTQASRWADAATGILLASGAGALGVRLGMPVYEGGEVSDRPEMGIGEDADTEFLQSTVGLVWRALVLGLLLLTLLGIASWVGH